MLFQGQEFGSRQPFVYFADHESPLRDDVAKGRREFLEQFVRLRDPAVHGRAPRPHDAASFGSASCIAIRTTRSRRRGARCTTTCCACGATVPRVSAGAHVLDGAALDATLLLLRYFGDDDADWLLLLNAGADRDVAAALRAADRAAARAALAATLVQRSVPVWRTGRDGVVAGQLAGARPRAGRDAGRARRGRRRMTLPIHAPDLLSELAPLVRRIPFVAGETPTLEEHGSREWLVTNGLGGYASGTVTGALTRRFHGLLVAALPSPLGRTDAAHASRGAPDVPRRASATGSACTARPVSSRRPKRAATSRSSGSRRDCRSGATSSTARSSRSRC